MKDQKAFKIDIFGLSNKSHFFDFKFDHHLFSWYEGSLVDKGNGFCKVELSKTDSMINLKMEIVGNVELECDRSLKLFDHPIEVTKEVIYKYGDEEKELSEDVFVITKNQQEINISDFLYETISLEVPMRKIHPDHLDDSEEQIFYSSKSKEDEEKKEDPRWDALKKLK